MSENVECSRCGLSMPREACHRCDGLTFAEAMALDPSEVEASVDGLPFRPLSDLIRIYTVEAMRSVTRFRRARPKRTRAQEMADDAYGGERLSFSAAGYLAGASDAIRAASDWIKDRPPTSSRTHAEDLVRAFLDPR